MRTNVKRFFTGRTAGQEAVATCKKHDELQIQRNQRLNFLQRLNECVQAAEGDCRRQTNRQKVDRENSLPYAVRHLQQVTAEHDSLQKQVVATAAELTKIEAHILADGDFLPALEGERDSQQQELAKAEAIYEQFVLKNLAAGNKSVADPEAAAAVQKAKIAIAATEQAIAMVQSLHRQQALCEAVRAALPRIEAIMASRDKTLSTIEGTEKELAAELEALQQQGLNLLGGLPAINFQQHRDAAADILKQLTRDAKGAN